MKTFWRFVCHSPATTLFSPLLIGTGLYCFATASSAAQPTDSIACGIASLCFGVAALGVGIVLFRHDEARRARLLSTPDLRPKSPRPVPTTPPANVIPDKPAPLTHFHGRN